MSREAVAAYWQEYGAASAYGVQRSEYSTVVHDRLSCRRLDVAFRTPSPERCTPPADASAVRFASKIGVDFSRAEDYHVRMSVF